MANSIEVLTFDRRGIYQIDPLESRWTLFAVPRSTVEVDAVAKLNQTPAEFLSMTLDSAVDGR